MQRSNARDVWLSGLWLIAAAALISPVCGFGQTLARIEQSRVVNLGFVTDRPPFSSLTNGGTPRGYAIDMCMHVVEALRLRWPDLQVYLVPVDEADSAGMLEQEKIDISCGAIAETLTARERVSFSLPIYFTGIGALVRKDAPPALIRVLSGQISHTGPTWRATVNAGLANQQYAIHSGTVRESWVRERIAGLGVIAKVTPVTSYDAGLELVKAHRVDAFFADRAGLNSVIAANADQQQFLVLERRFTVEPMGLAIKRGDEDFRLAVDTALSRLYRRGEYLNTYLTYFGEPSATARMLFEAYALR
jgi:polar amino acid transport system substrate-binding protein